MTLTRLGFCENGTVRNGFGAERRHGRATGRSILNTIVPVLFRSCCFASSGPVPVFRARVRKAIPVLSGLLLPVLFRSVFRSFPVLAFSGPFRSSFAVPFVLALSVCLLSWLLLSLSSCFFGLCRLAFPRAAAARRHLLLAEPVCVHATSSIFYALCLVAHCRNPSKRDKHPARGSTLRGPTIRHTRHGERNACTFPSFSTMGDAPAARICCYALIAIKH